MAALLPFERVWTVRVDMMLRPEGVTLLSQAVVHPSRAIHCRPCPMALVAVATAALQQPFRRCYLHAIVLERSDICREHAL